MKLSHTILVSTIPLLLLAACGGDNATISGGGGGPPPQTFFHQRADQIRDWSSCFTDYQGGQAREGMRREAVGRCP